MLQRAEVRCSIETSETLSRQGSSESRCSARKCAALLRPLSARIPGVLARLRCSARKCAALLRRDVLARVVAAHSCRLQRAEVRCSIETPGSIRHRHARVLGLQRAEVRCSIETSIQGEDSGDWRFMLQRAEVRCSIETPEDKHYYFEGAGRCSARKCAALLRRWERTFSRS